tara:strand:- start:14956 stop:15108 length:153 start_codon:yes stop_codon:yes gene_type:complete
MASLNNYKFKLLAERINDLLKIIEEMKILLSSVVSGMKQVSDILEKESEE